MSTPPTVSIFLLLIIHNYLCYFLVSSDFNSIIIITSPNYHGCIIFHREPIYKNCTMDFVGIMDGGAWYVLPPHLKLSRYPTSPIPWLPPVLALLVLSLFSALFGVNYVMVSFIFVDYFLGYPTGKFHLVIIEKWVPPSGPFFTPS